jgi:hypothetical protein
MDIVDARHCPKLHTSPQAGPMRFHLDDQAEVFVGHHCVQCANALFACLGLLPLFATVRWPELCVLP